MPGFWPSCDIHNGSRVIVGSRDHQNAGAVGYGCVMRLCGLLVQYLLVRLVFLDGCVLTCVFSSTTKTQAATAAQSHGVILLGMSRRRAAAVKASP